MSKLLARLLALMVLLAPFQLAHAEDDGGGDGGGGNGILNRPLEAYRFRDITTLPEYRRYIAPIDKAIEFAIGNGKRQVLGTLAKNLKWYFIPLHLDKLPRADINVEFDTDQMARQKYGEVWIDKTKYRRMSTQNKGVLLLHELVMALYRVQFQSYRFYCDTLMDIQARRGCNNEFIKRAFHPYYQAKEQNEFLKNEQYPSIRDAGEWLLHNYKRMNWIDLNTRFYQDGFDPRVFNPSLNDYEGQEKLTPEELKYEIETEIRAKTFPRFGGFQGGYPLSGAQNGGVTMNIEGHQLTLELPITGSKNLTLKFEMPDALILNPRVFRSGLSITTLSLYSRGADYHQHVGTYYTLELYFNQPRRTANQIAGFAIYQSYGMVPGEEEALVIGDEIADLDFLSSRRDVWCEDKGVRVLCPGASLKAHTDLYFSVPQTGTDHLLGFFFSDSIAPMYEEELLHPTISQS